MEEPWRRWHGGARGKEGSPSDCTRIKDLVISV